MTRISCLRFFDKCRTLGLLAAIGVGLLVPGRANAEKPTASNVVYIESNAAGAPGNAVLGFRRGADGSLTPLPGSPFPTGGTGVTPTFDLGPFDSDQNVIVNPEHTLLFAVNGGSDSIAVFHIEPDGNLVPAQGSPFPSGGSNPVSVGLAGNVLCVVNKDQDPGHPGNFLPDYTTFRVTPEGRLTPIPRSTVFVDAGSSPSQALVSPDNRLLFGADFMGGLLRSFLILPNGRLFPREAQPLPPSEFAGTGQPPFPLGMRTHPRLPLLYVGFVTINRLGVYHYGPTGQLHFVRTVPNSGQALCWVITNTAGTRLYTSNTGDNSVSVYDLANPAEPVEIQKVTLKTPGSPFQVGLDPTGRFLHVVTQRGSASQPPEANALHVLSVDGNGMLTEVPSSPTTFPATDGTRPQGVAAL